MSLKDQICEATDALRRVKHQHLHAQATYDDMKEAAIRLLELRNEALKKMGKRPRKITPLAIAHLLR